MADQLLDQVRDLFEGQIVSFSVSGSATLPRVLTVNPGL